MKLSNTSFANFRFFVKISDIKIGPPGEAGLEIVAEIRRAVFRFAVWDIMPEADRTCRTSALPQGVRTGGRLLRYRLRRDFDGLEHCERVSPSPSGPCVHKQASL